MAKLYPEEFYNSADWFVDRHVREGRGDNICAYTDKGNYTYRDIQKMANKMANMFKDLDIRMGDRIIMLVLDTPWFYSTFWGAVKMGAVPVPSSTMLTPADYEYYLNDSQARTLVVSSRLLPVVNQIEELRFLKNMIVVDDDGVFSTPYQQIYASASDEFQTVFTSADDVAFWLYTSGTTGGPKGAVHSQSDMQYSAEAYGKHILEITEKDICYSAARLFFTYGLGNAMFFPMSVGAAAVLNPDPPAPAHVFRLIKTYKATLFFGVPTLFGQMLITQDKIDAEKGAGADPKDHDLVSLRACPSAGEALPPDLYHKFKARYGVEILDGPGSTEMLHIYLSNKLGDVKPGSSGKPVPGYEEKIMDEEGKNELPDGEVGNLWIKGRSSLRYYWRKRDKTAATVIGEWVNSGDKYYKDAEGYYWPSGRADDMLKVGGIWVSPLEVENCLREHASVMECAVVGAMDEENLVKPKAFVVLNQGFAQSPELEKELKQWVLDRLAKFKYPRWIVFIDSLPKTATGKIQRFKLR
ncbi:benzoate-CoA ligase family protein [Syntrophus aciditrophicus]|uniref:4-hydroxybenzoate--CoA ligase / benzoate--CoA ligase n=2 Tax=cellular organisms TaxID=131567 RepID=Q2LRH0_SYNAS|nr:benzoate-CoA ligase family protein [Syntrophus aciditrophicus]ABC76683.1 4-hydroxybenzoate--CoA ligase / benzoate--CoA ligase [Syntrophus aciditrophicus SB]